MLVDNAVEVVDSGLEFCKLLLANGCPLMDHGDEPKGDDMLYL